jgi:hypothetical protein
MRRIIATVGMSAVLVLVPGLAAQAGGPIGTCPGAYELTHTFKGDPVDMNGDRYICEQPVPSAIPDPGGQGASLVIDNVLTH